MNETNDHFSSNKLITDNKDPYNYFILKYYLISVLFNVTPIFFLIVFLNFHLERTIYK